MELLQRRALAFPVEQALGEEPAFEVEAAVGPAFAWSSRFRASLAESKSHLVVLAECNGK